MFNMGYTCPFSSTSLMKCLCGRVSCAWLQLRADILQIDLRTHTRLNAGLMASNPGHVTSLVHRVESCVTLTCWQQEQMTSPDTSAAASKWHLSHIGLLRCYPGSCLPHCSTRDPCVRHLTSLPVALRPAELGLASLSRLGFVQQLFFVSGSSASGHFQKAVLESETGVCV